jgi:hypothetical protein
MSQKIYFAVLEEIYNNVVPRWSAVLISYTPYLFYKKCFKSEIISFCIWTQVVIYSKKKL